MHVPTESWMEIFKWLEQPAQIENISLVNYWFYDIIYTNLAKKYEKKQHRKKMPDLRFYRGCGGIAKLCELGTNRSFPIAEVPPPEYIQPFNRIDVHHFDELQVLSFFNAIQQWFQQGFLLEVKFRPIDGNPNYYIYSNRHNEFRQLIRTDDFTKFQMFASQTLLGHCFGLDNGEMNACAEPHQSIGHLLDENFVLAIPRIRGISFEDAFMIRWLFTPTTDGAQRIWILWTLQREMKNRIVQEFTNATIAQKFIVIFRPLQVNYVNVPPIRETRNRRTQECLRYCPMRIIHGCWDCIIRQPICEAAPDFNEISEAFYDMVIDGLPSNDCPTICLFAPFCDGTTTTEMASGSSHFQ